MSFQEIESTGITILVSVYTILIIYFIYRWYQNKDKMLVRIKSPTEKRILVAPEGNKVTIAKGHGKGSSYVAAWKAEFDLSCLYFTKGWFTKRLTMDVMPDATKAITYHKDMKPEDIPMWTRKELEENATLSGLRALQSLGEQKTSIVMWIIVVLLIIDIIIPFLTSGRIRF